MEVSTTLRWFGIDVSKATFDTALYTEDTRKAPHGHFSRTREGCMEFLTWVDGHVPLGQQPALVMEATGGYGKEMAKWLLALRQGLRVAIAQPTRVHHFAKGLGFQNKTDAQDAIMLARFGEVYTPLPYQPMTPAYEQLRALTRERAAMVKELVRLGNRNELPSDSRIAQKVRLRMIAHLEKAVADLEKAMATHIAKDAGLLEDCQRLQTVPGVGPVVAGTLMGELGDLREFPHPKALASFTGVAPGLVDSGTSVHATAHMTKHGSGRVRHMLYLAAMASMRGENPLSRSYDHLVQEGKPPMVALGALMRKILACCRAVLVANQDFDPNYKKKAPSEMH
jgi:transposase